jgi:23S rRNA G2445 N2-methylase RlmL
LTARAQEPESTFKFHLLLSESSAILKLVALVCPLAADELLKPGFKRVKSFVVAKAADIHQDKFVLECHLFGRNGNPLARCHISGSLPFSGHQLQDAVENCKAAKVPVELLKGDAQLLEHLADESVDEILSCPPFGHRFPKESENLFAHLLQEWSWRYW